MKKFGISLKKSTTHQIALLKGSERYLNKSCTFWPLGVDHIVYRVLQWKLHKLIGDQAFIAKFKV
jgi:hypothetical protein